MIQSAKPSIFAFLIACAAGIPGISAFADGAPSPEPLYMSAPPVVSEIDYAFEGARKINAESAAAHMRLKVGEPYFQETADASIRALYSTGLYEYAGIEPERLAGNKVKLRVTLVPRMFVRQIKFEGNREWEADSIWSGLSDETVIKVGDPLDEVLVKRSVEKIIKKYDKYYPFTEVRTQIIRDEATGDATVIFKINEGLATKVDSLTFLGNENVASDDLRPEIETSTWAWTFDPADFPRGRFVKFSWLSGYGRFHKEEFRKDLETLRDFYRNQGFLDVEISDKKVEKLYVEKDEEARKGRLSITIPINEGRRYAVGDIKIEGNELAASAPRFKSEAVLKVLAVRRRDFSRPYPIGDRVLDALFGSGVEAVDPHEIRTNFDSLQPGDWYSPKAVDNAVEKLRDYYGQVGYLNCSVVATRRPNLETGKIDLVFRVVERNKSYVNSINIYGNTKTRSRVLVRELALTPGEVFDTVRMKTSEARLRNTHFFDSVQVTHEPTNVPNRENMRIDVQEGRTGSLTFGAGFSTVEQLVGYAEYSESNFDIFNWRNWFRGGGQKFRVRVSIGNVSGSVEQSFEEPWAFQRDLRLGYNAYWTTNSYASDDYDVQTLGVNFYARRRIWENIEAGLSYTIEEKRLKDVAQNAPNFIKADEGSNLISKVGLTFSRDTRNDAFFPTSGSRLQLSQYVAGGPLGGDVNYYQFEARAAQWIPIFDAAEQTLQLLGRVGSMVGYGGNKHIPFYEKFYLGGSYDMRGFEYHHVGPFEGDEPTGGQTYAFFSAEYTIKIIEQLRFALFYDWGFVNSEDFDFGTSNYNDNFGVGFRVLVMGAVMRIDVGFPLTTSPQNDDGVRFNFSFGTVF